MLVSRRCVDVPEIGARISTFAVAHGAYRVHVVRNRNVTCDDGIYLAAMARLGHVSRPVLTVILRGTARVRVASYERWLGPGDMLAVPEKGRVAMRQQGERFESVAIEWTPGTIAGNACAIEHGRLDARALASVIAATERLHQTDDTANAAACLGDLLSTLRACGAPFDHVEAGELVTPVPERVVRLSRALDDALSRLDGGPMLVDLEATLKLSQRQIHRIVTRFNRDYGFNSGGWRDTVSRRRLLVGSSLMTAPGARTDTIARALGYASPTGFCHALALADLPSPGVISDVVARLE
jgi:hypothetical protein